MENQWPAKRRYKEEAGSIMDEDDRISQLPEHILQNHILSLLPQKHAVGTCLLSKSWRHLGPTRPKIEFHPSFFPGKNQQSVSVFEKTLRRYVNQNLSIQEFVLGVSDSESIYSIPLLDKWIPKVLMNKGLKTFNLSAYDFPLPLNLVFQSEFLEELFLKGCNLLDQKNFNSWGNKIQALKRLRTLSLVSVCIEKETFEKILSMCPLIQRLVLDSCTHGLSTSKHFEWFHLHKIYFFPRLKSLFLSRVHLPTEFLNNLSLSNNNCLRTLSLGHVRIEEETFEKIMSVCPLIEHLVLHFCQGLRTIKVKMARNLKHLECKVYSGRENGSIEIIDAPSLETIQIIATPSLESIHLNDSQNWYFNKNNYFFPRLKSLYLWNVHLPAELLNNLSSNNCPRLEELQLGQCSGFTEFKLSNRSIRRLVIIVSDRAIKATIDAANMIYFEFLCYHLPSISFATTSNEWKSCVSVLCSSSFFDADAISAWYLKLHEFLMALSQSQISLIMNYLPVLTNQDTFEGRSCEPVVVERLCLALNFYSSEIPDLLNCAFRICRPRYIRMPLYDNSHERCAEPIWKALVEKGETKFWQQDLEESSIQLSDKNTDEEWRSVQVCEFSIKENILLRLKWRDLNSLVN